ncbi:MAG: SDR family oxidoreductase [Ignavibacteriales bacterium]|nr:SDR family oxidoreductase [Ignavibacteriales bacterium]
MQNKLCLITGATSGIGKATAIELAKLGFDLILTGRNEIKGKDISDSLVKKYKINSVFFKCDISSLKEVRNLASIVNSKYDHLNVLINNAGSRFSNYQKSVDGIELTFATNHLGHFLLTQLLFDLLKKSSDARIINVSSSAHYGKQIDIDDLVSPKEYNRSLVYGRSKLANVLFTYEFARRNIFSNISINALDPGGVATNFAKNEGLFRWLKHISYYIAKRQLLTPKQGAETIVYLASSDNVKGITGKFFFKKKEIKSTEESYDVNKANKLWELSEQLCGIKY